MILQGHTREDTGSWAVHSKGLFEHIIEVGELFQVFIGDLSDVEWRLEQSIDFFP